MNRAQLRGFTEMKNIENKEKLAQAVYVRFIRSGRTLHISKQFKQKIQKIMSNEDPMSKQEIEKKAKGDEEAERSESDTDDEEENKKREEKKQQKQQTLSKKTRTERFAAFEELEKILSAHLKTLHEQFQQSKSETKEEQELDKLDEEWLKRRREEARKRLNANGPMDYEDEMRIKASINKAPDWFYPLLGVICLWVFGFWYFGWTWEEYINFKDMLPKVRKKREEGMSDVVL